jgi:hypothetical protein
MYKELYEAYERDFYREYTGFLVVFYFILFLFALVIIYVILYNYYYGGFPKFKVF